MYAILTIKQVKLLYILKNIYCDTLQTLCIEISLTLSKYNSYRQISNIFNGLQTVFTNLKVAK